MQDVTVTADLSSDSFGLTGAVTISRLDYNLAEEDFDRTDWTQFDFDGDGTNEALNPEPNYPPVDLTIDYPREFVRRVTGSVTGNGDQPNGDQGTVFITSRTSRWQEPLNSPSHDTNVTSKP